MFRPDSACYRRSWRDHVKVLERRVEFLTARIDRAPAEQAPRTSYDQEERASLRFAIAFITSRSGETAAEGADQR